MTKKELKKEIEHLKTEIKTLYRTLDLNDTHLLGLLSLAEHRIQERDAEILRLNSIIMQYLPPHQHKESVIQSFRPGEHSGKISGRCCLNFSIAESIASIIL